MRNNNSKLRDARVNEGLTVADLSRLSKVNEKTIRDIENGRRLGKEETKRKIVIGLNNNPGKTRTLDYEDIFGS